MCEYLLSLPAPFVEWYQSRLRFRPRLKAACANCRISPAPGAAQIPYPLLGPPVALFQPGHATPSTRQAHQAAPSRLTVRPEAPIGFFCLMRLSRHWRKTKASCSLAEGRRKGQGRTEVPSPAVHRQPRISSGKANGLVLQPSALRIRCNHSAQTVSRWLAEGLRLEV